MSSSARSAESALARFETEDASAEQPTIASAELVCVCAAHGARPISATASAISAFLLFDATRIPR